MPNTHEQYRCIYCYEAFCPLDALQQGDGSCPACGATAPPLSSQYDVIVHLPFPLLWQIIDFARCWVHRIKDDESAQLLDQIDQRLRLQCQSANTSAAGFQVNWSELRLIGVWAERWGYLASAIDLAVVQQVNQVALRLQAQFPCLPLLTPSQDYGANWQTVS